MDKEYPAGLDPASLRLNLFEEVSVYILSVITNVNSILKNSGDTEFNVDILLIAMWSKLDSYDGTLDTNTRIVLNSIICSMLQDLFNFVDSCTKDPLPIFQTVLLVKDLEGTMKHQIVTVPSHVAGQNKFSAARIGLIVQNSLEFFIDYKIMEVKRVQYSELGVQSQGYVNILRFTGEFLNYFITFIKRK